MLSAENDLLEALCVEICELMFTLEKRIWDELLELHKNNTKENDKLVDQITCSSGKTVKKDK